MSGHSSTVAKMTLTEDGIRLESANAFRQTIDAEHTLSALRGCMVTFSVLLECVSGANGQIGIVCGGSWLQPVEPLPKTAGQHLIFCTVSIPEDAASITPWYYSATDGAYILKAAKLELGDRQTLARKNAGGEWELIDPPEYDLQYALCSLYSPITGAWVGYSFSNSNLLDNADFRNPINQRGLTTVSGNAYFIDRWRIYAGELSLSASGIVVNAGTILTQMLEPDMLRNLSGHKLTASFLTADNELISGSVMYTYGKQAIFAHLGDPVYCQLYLDAAVNAFQFYYSSKQQTIIAAKLELGPVQTLAHKEGDAWVLNDPPPNQALELEKCQRYFVRMVIPSWSRIGYGAANTGNFTINIPLPVAMRANPAITFSDTTWKTDPKDVVITQMASFGGLSGNEAQVLVYTSSEANGEFVRLRNFTDAAAYIDFSADL